MDRRYYSAAHFRRIANATTPSEIRWRAKDEAARKQAYSECRELFPIVTADNFQEAADWMERRRRELLGDDA